jgi:hypothetical protein
MRYAIGEDRNSPIDAQGKQKKRLSVRISLAKHNIQRVEATFVELTSALLEDGFSLAEINKFYGKCVNISGRDINAYSTLYNIGPLINKADEFIDIFSPACRDGVVMSPSGNKVVLITSPTIYDPSGEVQLPLVPGNASNLIPEVLTVENYAGEFRGNIKQRIQDGRLMISTIKKADGSEYSLPDLVDDVVLKLGREVASYVSLIRDFALFSSFSINGYYESLEHFGLIPKAYRERKELTQRQIERAEALTSSGNLSPDVIEKVKFYVLLNRVQMAKMDLLSDLVDDGFLHETHISGIANVLLNIGRDQVSALPQILQGLRELDGIFRNVPSHNSVLFMDEFYSKVVQVLGPHFGFTEFKGAPIWLNRFLLRYNPVRYGFHRFALSQKPS